MDQVGPRATRLDLTVDMAFLGLEERAEQLPGAMAATVDIPAVVTAIDHLNVFYPRSWIISDSISFSSVFSNIIMLYCGLFPPFCVCRTT